jgi:hypothetical protein
MTTLSLRTLPIPLAQVEQMTSPLPKQMTSPLPNVRMECIPRWAGQRTVLTNMKLQYLKKSVKEAVALLVTKIPTKKVTPRGTQGERKGSILLMPTVGSVRKLTNRHFTCSTSLTSMATT